jgi:hypothetical protein
VGRAREAAAAPSRLHGVLGEIGVAKLQLRHPQQVAPVRVEFDREMIGVHGHRVVARILGQKGVDVVARNVCAARRA